MDRMGGGGLRAFGGKGLRMRGDQRFEAVAVGYVRSAFRDIRDAPRQGRDAGAVAEIEILPGYLEALEGLSDHPRIWVVCWMHRARRDLLRLVPRATPGGREVGVFATRSPSRPNPLALYLVDLLGVRGGTLTVRGMDALDGTPVLDLRPHIPRLDT